MKKVPVSEIQDGMVLAQPITGPGGNVLLGIGMTLRANLSSRLTAWGIPSVWIEAEDQEKSETSSDASGISVRDRLDLLFKGRQVNSAMRTIFAAILKHRGIDDGPA
jgi:hypothetical protein